MIEKRQLATWIRAELENAEGYGGGELATMRQRALDRYYGRALGNEIEGRSTVQSNDIADMVEACIAQMLPGLAGGDSIVEFEPLSDDDVEQAQLESDVVNRTIIETNRGYTVIQEAVRDALLLRNGWVKVWEDTRKDVRKTRVKGVPEEAVAAVQMGAGEGVEVDEVEQRGGGLVDFTVVETIARKRVVVSSVDPVNMRWKAGFESVFIDEIGFLAECWWPTRSTLVEEGYSKALVDGLPRSDGPKSVDQAARNQSSTTGWTGGDPANDLIECHWIHYRYDSDGDGITELHRILFAPAAQGGEVLEDEVVEFIPYATGTAILQPHRLNGLGIYDKLKQTELAKTEILRQWVDNLGVSNNSRLAINTRAVNLEDAVASRPGGIIRVTGEVGTNLMPIPSVDVGQSALLALEYQDKIRSERAGASLDLQAAQLQIAGDTAHGVERQMGSREQMAAMMSRTLAETLIRQMYILTHRALRTWVDEPIRAQKAGAFIETTPAEWQERDRVNVKSGLSVGERSQRRLALEAILAQQEKLAAAGYDGVLVTAQGYHAALMDWSRAAEVDNANRYFLDPASKESQQAAAQKMAKLEQQQGAQLQIASTAAASAQQGALIEQTVGARKAQAELSFKYWQAILDAEIEMRKMVMPAAPVPEDDQEIAGLQAVGMARSAAGG